MTTTVRLEHPPRLFGPEVRIDTSLRQRDEGGGPLAIAGAVVVCFGAAASAALGGRRRVSMAWS